ncbi:MAG: BMP family ABC transporter substrate-binding protein [Promethearchaeota archaeon]
MKKEKRLSYLIILIFLMLSLIALTVVTPALADGQNKEEELIVGCIFASPIGDMGWTYSHDLGRQYLEETLPYVKTIVEENVAPPDASAVADIMIMEGAKVVIFNDINYQDVAMAKGEQYPDKYFVYCAGPEIANNVASIFSAIYEPTYLTGILAGALSKTGKIGFVAAMPLPQVLRRINAMAIGAREVNPDAKIQVIYTNNWYDPPTEMDVSNTLISLGCDVIAQHQNSPASVQAASKKGVYSIGFHSDMRKFSPKLHVTAPIWTWGAIYVRIVEAYAKGTPLENVSIWGTMSDGSVDISPINPAVSIPSDILKLVEKRREELKEGKFDPFHGPCKDVNGEIKVKEGEHLSYQELREMNWYAEGVIVP